MKSLLFHQSLPNSVARSGGLGLSAGAVFEGLAGSGSADAFAPARPNDSTSANAASAPTIDRRNRRYRIRNRLTIRNGAIRHISTAFISEERDHRDYSPGRGGRYAYDQSSVIAVSWAHRARIRCRK